MEDEEEVAQGKEEEKKLFKLDNINFNFWNVECEFSVMLSD